MWYGAAMEQGEPDSRKDTVPLIDPDRAVERLLRLLAVSGPTGEEEPVRDFLVEELVRVGIPPEAIREDDAPARIDLPSQSGNLIALLSGTVPGPRRLLSAHMDTVALARGAQPVVWSLWPPPVNSILPGRMVRVGLLVAASS